MTYDAKEQSSYEGSPVELYRFTRGGDIWTYTSADTPQTHEGEIYLPTPLKRSNPEQSRAGQTQRLTVQVPENLEIALLFRIYPPPGPMALVITRLHRTDSSAEPIAFWAGKVRAATWSAGTCTLDCEPIGGALKRPGLRVQYQNSCNHILYGPECGLSMGTWMVAGTLSGVSGNDLTCAAFATKTDQWLRAGFVVIDGVYRMVVDHVGSRVTLLLPFEDARTGQVVTAYAGCTHAHSVCVSKFNNVLNYGGFPFVPVKNPYDNGLG